MIGEKHTAMSYIKVSIHFAGKILLTVLLAYALSGFASLAAIMGISMLTGLLVMIGSLFGSGGMLFGSIISLALALFIVAMLGVAVIMVNIIMCYEEKFYLSAISRTLVIMKENLIHITLSFMLCMCVGYLITGALDYGAVMLVKNGAPEILTSITGWIASVVIMPVGIYSAGASYFDTRAAIEHNTSRRPEMV